MNVVDSAKDAGDRVRDTRDRYPDALRAGALLVVVLGHWIATLPRLEGGRVVGTDHLLRVWESAGVLTWVVQVVPLFVFVSAAVSADGVARRLADGQRQRHWWAGRALGLARPTVTYLAVLAALALAAAIGDGRLLAPFDTSLTVHLWFLAMLLGVQALLPLCVRADRRFGLKAVVALVAVAAATDLLRAGVRAPGDLLALGAHVSGSPAGIGWLNMLVVWLLPQQLGIAWKRGRFAGAGAGAALLLLGAAWLVAAIASGYPVAMVGVGLAGNNMLPPTLALVGVMWVQVGLVLLAERPARHFLDRHPVARAVAVLGALGMPLYLWHKLAELPAAWLGGRLGVPIDAGDPGAPGFWTGRLLWIALCALAVAPVMAAVVGFEMRRRRDVAAADASGAIVAGGLALLGGLAASLALGAWPGALIGLALVGAASWLLRAHPQPSADARG
ncbi:acyltransferase family protein [Luteimonas sp. SJ-92]|uniref:Acyltransferase family protein n=1 Tax=Luteimonas salinisoli TaxID=2752307 RepID=A0A853JEM3_9GAMM|nr:acyltransferase family protein [Luteimonas salinisoli]NZA27776.1 acyltransferase family protein [Luteimonas salinisoli]